MKLVLTKCLTIVVLVVLLTAISSIGYATDSEAWICSNCENAAMGNFCSNCGSPKPSPLPNEWICSNCGHSATGNFCSNCGTAFTSKSIESTAESIHIDFENEVDFEAALNRGEMMIGKVVCFKVRSVQPNSVVGFNLWAGEHLNFVSSRPVEVKEGDILVVKISDVRSALRSWLLSYIILEKITGESEIALNQTNDGQSPVVYLNDNSPASISTTTPLATSITSTPVTMETSAPIITPEQTSIPDPVETPKPIVDPTNTTSPMQARTETPTQVATGKQKTETKEDLTSIPTGKPIENWLAEYGYDISEAIIIPADVLYEYGSAYIGKTVVTAIVVEEKEASSLKANTANNDTYSFSVVANFSDKGEISSVKEESTVILVGVVDKMNPISFLGANKTVTLNYCHIVTKGITVIEIEATHDDHIQNAKAKATTEEQRVSDRLAQQKQEYIDSCEKVNYSDVERNPRQYKKKLIQITGTVIQVKEGWFGSVTLRVKQYDGNVWYVTYNRTDDSESRILEGDLLTFYGECTGVESYTTILRSTVTIPAMEAKYYK